MAQSLLFMLVLQRYILICSTFDLLILFFFSYLNYGLLAAQAGILGLDKDADNPCILAGYDGVYSYGGIDYKVSAPSSGSNIIKCRKQALEVLKVNEYCPYKDCTFGGVGFIDESQRVVEARPLDFQVVALGACLTTLEDAKSKYPKVAPNDLPYLCMDLVYQYTLLVDGFGKFIVQLYFLVLQRLKVARSMCVWGQTNHLLLLLIHLLLRNIYMYKNYELIC
ncbi:putative apyrase [Helianthus anomalus]